MIRARSPVTHGIAIAGPALGAVMLALVLAVLAASPAAAQTKPQEIEAIEREEAANVDRYRITIIAGSSLWEVATERMPLKSLDDGHQATFAVLEESFHRDFGDRKITEVYPGESFVLEVPAGTFVAKSIDETPTEVRYTSFNGDLLTHYPRDLYVIYRLIRKENPNRAEVLLAGPEALAFVPDPDPIELAKQVYQVGTPDFLQVRQIRDVLSSGDPNPRVTVNLEHRYLDEFRNYRDRATSVEEGENGLKIYTFSDAQVDVPFLRVEDGIGDEVEAVRFPRVFRVEYYKDGRVKNFRITQPGDLLAVLKKPDNARWARLYSQWDTWLEGDASALEPYGFAVGSTGALLPGRILVVTYQPKPERGAGSGMECLGIPLVLLAGGLVLSTVNRQSGLLRRLLGP